MSLYMKQDGADERPLVVETERLQNNSPWTEIAV